MAETVENGSPPRMGRRNTFRGLGFLPLSAEPLRSSSLATHGALNNLITEASIDASSIRSASPYRAESIHSEIYSGSEWGRSGVSEHRRRSQILNTPQMRSQRLIGNCNPRYRWERYWKSDEELKSMKKPLRAYYQRNNALIQRYLYVDQLLDSSLPSDLLNEYTSIVPNVNSPNPSIPPLILESHEPYDPPTQQPTSRTAVKKVSRTPHDIYTVTERTPLFQEDDESGPVPDIPGLENDSVESGDRIVKLAIYVNLLANAVLLAGKIVVIVLTSSLSVLASLVDAALDFLSTAVVWTTTKLIEYRDIHQYPIGRRKLEPIGVLVFSIIITVSFFQVGLQCLNRLTSGDHSIIQLPLSSIVIMTATILIKFCCWLWCRVIKNSSVQALAQDAMTDVVFNIFSIIFPLIGFYARFWWLDATGGLLLSLYVIVNWAGTSLGHIKNLTGQAATADERNVLLYLTMRFATTIKQVQGLQVYHSGDHLIVEADIILDENTSLKDSHDLSESLQYILESVPYVDRAFVHTDYVQKNFPTHMAQ